MNDKNISQEILDKIKDVKPKPRWQFVLKDCFIWFLASLSLIVSSLALAVIIYMMIDNDWDIYNRITNSLLEFVLLTLPYFWLLFLGIFILIAYYNFRHTKKGYRYPLSEIFLVSLLINILLGTFLYNMDVGKIIDNTVANRVPFYKEIINHRKHIWSRVDEGFLGGVVMAIDNDYLFIRDLDGNIWTIEHFNTTTPEFLMLKVGQPVRIIGQKIDSQNFEMHLILPMRGMNWIKGDRLGPPPLPIFDERNF